MRLNEYIDALQRKGNLWFTKQQALSDLGCTPYALKKALLKLRAKKRIAIIKSQFVLIIPIEYQKLGIIPADWFIDPLMEFLGIPYYVSVLSSAQLHGAAHQKPMQFQVVAKRDLRDIKFENVHIRFLYSANAGSIPVQKIQVHSGYMVTATPEVTAFDICKYYKAAGYWNNIATVLSELKEVIVQQKLTDLALSGMYDLPIIQRLGYLLSLPEVDGANLTADLAKIVQSKNARWVPLSPSDEIANITKDPIWRIYINTEVDIDI